MVTITDTLNIIKQLLLAPSCLATRKRLFLLRRWTRTMAVAITCIGPLGMGFKILPRAIGKRAGLQLPFSVILALRSRAGSRTIRARRNNPGGLFRLLRSRARSSTWLRRRPGLGPALALPDGRLTIWEYVNITRAAFRRAHGLGRLAPTTVRTEYGGNKDGRLYRGAASVPTRRRRRQAAVA
jgi:hypothetical protein